MANLLKIVQGGWMPLAVGAVLMVVMLTWSRGTRILAEKARKDDVRLAQFIEMLARGTSGSRAWQCSSPSSRILLRARSSTISSTTRSLGRRWASPSFVMVSRSA